MSRAGCLPAAGADLLAGSAGQGGTFHCRDSRREVQGQDFCGHSCPGEAAHARRCRGGWLQLSMRQLVFWPHRRTAMQRCST
jgi:hypothetical protein